MNRTHYLVASLICFALAALIVLIALVPDAAAAPQSFRVRAFVTWVELACGHPDHPEHITVYLRQHRNDTLPTVCPIHGNQLTVVSVRREDVMGPSQ